MSVIRVLVVDDHAIVRDGVRALLGRAEDIDVVGEAGSGRDAIALARALSPDVILMDIAMPDLGGLEATLEIRKERPESRIVILSQYGDPEYVKRALKYRYSSPNTCKTHLPIPFVEASCIARRTTRDSQRVWSDIERARWRRSICFRCTRTPFPLAHPVELK